MDFATPTYLDVTILLVTDALAVLEELDVAVAVVDELAGKELIHSRLDQRILRCSNNKPRQAG